MRAIGETLGLLLGIAIAVWVVLIALSEKHDKPVIACKPLAAVANISRDAIAALSPEGVVAHYAATAENRVDRACLTYAANWFRVAEQ